MILRSHVFCLLLAFAVILTTIPLRAEVALTPLPIQSVQIEDEFWSPKLKVWREVTILDCFAKFEKDGALANFDKIRDGVGGEHGGPPWYDGLIYEMIRGCADMLATRRDPALEARIDGCIERIAAAAAKDPDGYLNTYTQLKEPTHRWGLNGGNDNWQHDVYNAGAMIEAAVHYYRATGKTQLLQVATRLANHMADLMGPAPKMNIVPGHSLGEEALVKLYCLFREQPELKSKMPSPVDEARYLKLVEFWIENHGNHEGRKSYGSYGQDHKSVFQQQTIEGHAVRATLLCTGLVAAAIINGRQDYLAAAKRLWENMVQRRMYVIGGLGAIAGHEGFGPDYVLPNDGYLETCAAIGAGFFHHNMNLAFADARYADELERVLYNAVLPGVSLQGNTYFYENPIEASPNRTRWTWHSCPCCPPMFLKIMGALPSYIYATNSTGVFMNLYIGSQARAAIGTTSVSLRQTTRYPWQGTVRIAVDPAAPAEFDLHLRVPAWCQGVARPDDLYTIAGRPESGAFVVKVNGEPVAAPIVAGYARIHRRWQANDIVDVEMQMPVRRVLANPLVKADAGKVALQRGPLVYCLESIDNQGRVRNLSVPDDAKLSTEFRQDLFGGAMVIRGEAMASFADAPAPKPAQLLAVPYYANANRGSVSMCVWIPKSPADAIPASITDEATATASHTNPGDTLLALNNGRLPANSADQSIPRFTWWDHKGTAEWVQYTFDHPARLTAAAVYWWDEERIGRHCRVPATWRLVYRDANGHWTPVHSASAYGTKVDQFNRVSFEPVETTAIRIEAQLQPQWSGGILEWRLEGTSQSHTATPAGK